MALDGVFLSSILKELNNEILNSKIDKINQPEKDELLITLRGIKNKKLLISASSTYPRIHFSSISKTNPAVPPMFCMVLRKHLIGGRIQRIYQIDNDRILCLEVSNTDEMGFDSIYTLVIEIMGRHSNITLVRERDNKVMDCIKHITADINSYRILLPGVSYKFPPKSNKLDPFCYDRDTALKIYNSLEKIDKNFFSNTFTGIGKTLSWELYLRAESLGSITFEALINALGTYLEPLKDGMYDFILYKDNKPKDFYLSSLNIYNNFEQEHFDNPSELLEIYYSQKDKQDRIKSKSQDIEKLINTNLDRCYKKQVILQEVLHECSSKDDFRTYGELLTANIYSLKPGDKKVSLWNYYSDNNEYIDIDLDPNLSPSENIQRYYKKYNKMKKSEASALEQQIINQEEIEYLTSVLNNLTNSESYDEIQDIRSELIETGYIRYKKNNKKKDKPTKPHHYVSSQGFDIYVGKNNIQNDYLTLKFANKADLWLHTKNIPGSHVIIKGKDIPEETIYEAAALAAFFSKGKNSSKVPVDYTEIKNVKKPSGAKPGMVIYSTNKTIYVDPCEKGKRKEN